MRKITEQSITAIAPNAAAASNGKKLSTGGSFVKLQHSGDDTFYMGECKGSGKNPYITSADFIDGEHPVYRCSCPSRQFPCKHCLGLLYEMMSGKNFEICEIPEDIIKKRNKLAAKSAPVKSAEEMTPEEAEKAAKKKVSAAKTAGKARAKKLETQLAGLDLVEKAVKDLMTAGLGTMGGASLKTYQNISKQLGDYYLVGPQRLFNRLIIEITEYQKDNLEVHYDNAIDTIEKLYSLLKKSRQYINEKLENNDVSNDDTVLYEELGGAWKLSELEAIGKCKKNVRLMQLSFWVTFDEARKEYIDSGIWTDLSDGIVYITKNYRPLKSLKYVKAQDSVFGVVTTPSMAVYPGDGTVRVRWESAEYSDAVKEDYKKLRGFSAQSIGAISKEIKNTLKNAIASPMIFKTVAFSKIGETADGVALKSMDGDTLLLKDCPELEPTTERLYMLPNKEYLENGVMLCGFFYNAEMRRLCAQPLCIIPDGEDVVIRLLY